MLKLLVALININPLRSTYNNALNVIRNLYCCKQNFPLFWPDQWEVL